MSIQEKEQLKNLPPLPEEVEAKLRAIVNLIIDRVQEEQVKGVTRK